MTAYVNNSVTSETEFQTDNIFSYYYEKIIVRYLLPPNNSHFSSFCIKKSITIFEHNEGEHYLSINIDFHDLSY